MKINFGLKPFWFWNGEMSDDKIAGQIREMSRKGVGGFFIHPRQGLTVPYLSGQWFEKVGVAVEAAKKYDLEVWLYDELAYPSGIAGGEVVNGHAGLEAKVLDARKLDVEGHAVLDMGFPMGVVIDASAYPVKEGGVQWGGRVDLSEYIGVRFREKIYQESGLTHYNAKRFFGGDMGKAVHWRAPAGMWRVYVFIEVPVKNFKYFGTFIDPLNPAATERFIALTHERYKKHFGGEFGRTIKGIFVDETAPFGGDIPWSPLLPEMFEGRNGYSLAGNLPALLEYAGKGTDRIRYDYWNTVTDSFIANFDVKIHRWCMDNNLLYVGEKPILRSSQLKHMDIPGVDAGHRKAGDAPLISDGIGRHSAKVGSSAAHFYGKERVLCEAFHSIGWSMNYQDMKWIIDWLTVCGINMFVPHGYFYTTDGLAKHDAPPSSFFQMPAWKHNSLLSDYVRDLNGLLAARERKAEVLVLDPVTSMWTAMGEKKRLKEKLAGDFGLLQDIMLRQHVDYYIIDPELLAAAEVKAGSLYIEGERFGALVIPPVLNMDRAVISVIREYALQGGILAAAGCLPVENIDDGPDTAQIFNEIFGLDSRKIYESYLRRGTGEPDLQYEPALRQGPAPGLIRKGNSVFSASVKDIPGCLKMYLGEDFGVFTGGRENEEILAAHYGDVYFLVNVSNQSCDARVRIRYEGGGTPALGIIPLGTGGKAREQGFELSKSDFGLENLEYKFENGYLNADLYFHPFQSYALRLDNSAASSNAGADRPREKYRLEISGEWDISTASMNALRLYHWELEVSSPEGSAVRFREASKERVKSKPIIDQVIDGRLSLPVQVKDYFGCPKELRFPQLQCRYRTGFTADALMPLWMVIEPGGIEGEWHMLLNGKIIKPEDFTQKEVYLPTNLVCEITPMVKAGENSLEVFVKTSATYHGVVNPIYIFGNFGLVKGKTPTPTENYMSAEYWHIGPAPAAGEVGKLPECGLPFYSGEVVYTRLTDISEDYFDAPEGKGSPGGTDNPYTSAELEIYIDDPGMRDPAELRINGRSAGIRLWSPYCWRVEKAWLKPHGNTMELRMTTSLLGLFEGQAINPADNRTADL